MESVPVFEDLPDYEDIKDFLPDPPAGFESGAEHNFVPDMRAAVVVEGLPVITRDKQEKMVAVLAKKLGAAAALTDEMVHVPYGEDGQSLGFAFIKAANEADAKTFVKVLTQLEFSKKHILSAYPYSDLDRVAHVPDEYVEPEPQPFVPRPDVTSWLTDSQFRDQFVVRYVTRESQETEVFWCNAEGEPSMAYDGSDQKAGGRNWVEKQVEWSPKGTYLATFHPQGIVLWAGERFARCGRFAHPGVEGIAFSPDERFLLTYRLNGDPSAKDAIIVWNIREGTKLRNFGLKDPFDKNMIVHFVDKQNNKNLFGKITWSDDGQEFTINCGGPDVFRGICEGPGVFKIEDKAGYRQVEVRAVSNPNVFKWSHDGNYIARMGGDIISVYELPGMKLMDSRSIATERIVDFEWCPSSNLLAYWALGIGNTPSRVTMVRVPSREEIPGRNLFGVSDGRLYWQDRGEFLCVQMMRQTGKKGVTAPRLMVLRVTETSVPVEQVDLEEPVLHLAWEPSGERFSVVTGDRRQQNLHFYGMTAPGGKKELTLLSSLGGADKIGSKHLNQFDSVSWSPAGSIAMLAFFPTDGTQFEIYDVDTKSYITTAPHKHDLGREVHWDPSGRFVASAAKPLTVNLKADLDYGFAIFTFQGEQVCRVRKENLTQFLWRPRPQLLTPAQRDAIRKNLNQYKRQFEKEDRERRQAHQREIRREHTRLARAFLAVLQDGSARYAAAKQQRVALHDGYDSDDEGHYIVDTEIVETVVSVKETPAK